MQDNDRDEVVDDYIDLLADAIAREVPIKKNPHAHINLRKAAHDDVLSSVRRLSKKLAEPKS